jgi:hypothetical protein
MFTRCLRSGRKSADTGRDHDETREGGKRKRAAIKSVGSDEFYTKIAKDAKDWLSLHGYTFCIHKRDRKRRPYFGTG